MDYINNTMNYLKSSLESIKSAVISTKDIIVSIGKIIGTVAELLGFIGFRVFILLMTTAFVLWLLNLVSPVTRKTNYVVAVGLVLWLAITAKMPVQIVILKYALIIISPFIISYIANFLIKNFNKVYKFVLNKIYSATSRINFKFLGRKKYILGHNDNIGLLLSSDLPTINEIKQAKYFIKALTYNISILEDEKISLVDDNNRIIFLNETKVSQFKRSIASKDIKLLWFWSEDYNANELLDSLSKTKKIVQNKDIIGGGDNSFILNFLQQKWNWEVIYGQNLKHFIIKYQHDKKTIADVIENTTHSLNLINDYTVEEGFFLRDKIVGSDLFVLVNEIGTANQLNFRNKILFLDIVVESRRVLYRLINQLQNHIISRNMKPRAIVFGNIALKDSANPTEIIKFFSKSLDDGNIHIPFFKIQDFDFVRLNRECLIEYKNSAIILKF